MRRLVVLLGAAAVALAPGSAEAQRFGGDYGGAGGFWLVYFDPGLEAAESFGRDVGAIVALGGRGFLQTGRFRLGGGGVGGGFVDEGTNASGNTVSGGFSGGGLVAEYLAVQRNVELAVGGMVGGGVLTVEESLAVNGDVEDLRRRRDSIFTAYPWVRLGWNPAALVNVGLQVGYLIGTSDVGGFAVGLDILVGLIP
jgi:hypothetical protein